MYSPSQLLNDINIYKMFKCSNGLCITMSYMVHIDGRNAKPLLRKKSVAK